MKSYFLSSLLGAVLLLVSPFALRAANEPEGTVTGSGVELLYEPGAERRSEKLDVLRELDRELTRLFRAPPARRGRCRVIFSAARRSDALEMRRTTERTDILLGDRFYEAYEADPVFRKKLTRALLLARFAAVEGARPLPEWIGAGLDGIVAANRSSGRIARNIRYYPVLRSLLISNNMPDFRELTLVENPRFTGATLQSFEELSRFLLETSSAASSLKDNALGDYVMMIVSNNRRPEEAYDMTIRRVLGAMSPGVSAELMLRFAAERMAFNSRTPRPGDNALALLPGVLTIEFMPLGRDGKVKTGAAKEKASFETLPLLFKNKHPDAANIRLDQIRRLRDFAFGFPAEVMPYSEKIVMLLEKSDGSDPEEERKSLAAAVIGLNGALRRQAAIENELEKVENQTISPYIRFHADLGEESRGREILTERSRAFLNQIESEYLTE